MLLHLAEVSDLFYNTAKVVAKSRNNMWYWKGKCFKFLLKLIFELGGSKTGKIINLVFIALITGDVVEYQHRDLMPYDLAPINELLRVAGVEQVSFEKDAPVRTIWSEVSRGCVCLYVEQTYLVVSLHEYPAWNICILYMLHTNHI